MFSSDVSARGMDYPDVSAVVQLGLPSEKAQYIHRLGRTARAGKEGGGYLLLADFEAGFLRQLGDLPIATRPPLTPAQVPQPLHAAAGKPRVGAMTGGLGG
jgi:ATP-dependent RNA helicase MSS116